MNPIHPSRFSEADARVFATVAAAGSFSAASGLLAMTPSAVSKAITRLEADLGVRLLARTTRSLHLTEEGRVFQNRAMRAFEALAEAAEAVAPAGGRVRGLLRLGLPSLFGSYVLGPRLPLLLREHPGLQIELVCTLRPSELVERGLDAVVAVGDLPDSSLVARPLGWGQFVTVAAPGYLAAAGEPSRVQELVRHRGVAFRMPDGRLQPWTFGAGNGELLTIEPPPGLASDDMHHLAAMAVHEGGIAHLPLFVVAEALEQGRLRRLLAAQDPSPKPAWLLHAAARAPSRRLKVLLDFLTQDAPVMPGVAVRRR